MLNEQQMKNIINQKSKEYEITPQQMGALFAMEQLLKKVSQSEFQEYFILKGGFLLATRYGLDNRTTKDLDATIMGTKLTDEMIRAFSECIEQHNETGSQSFKVNRVRKIREQFDYDGYNLKMLYTNGRVRYPFAIDLTTGEDILPVTKEDKIPLMFEEGHVLMKSYPVEQVLADKLYTTLAYGQIDDTNSRSKDLYDLYFLTQTSSDLAYRKIDEAMEKTMKQRDALIHRNKFSEIIESLAQSDYQKELWHQFQNDNSFVQELAFETVMESVASFTNKLVETVQQEKRKKESDIQMDFLKP